MANASDKTKGVWIYGETGIGKSTRARTMCIDPYLKMCNKWWDGYANQRQVLIDDLDKNHKCLGHHLKIWSDHYGFIGETKGGAITPDFDIIVITSQYSIEQIWEGDQETIDALRRRFKYVHLYNP